VGSAEATTLDRRSPGRGGPYRQAAPPPARHRPGARSARRPRCYFHPIADRGACLMATRKPIRSTSSRRFTPHLEALEDRSLPSTFTVLNLADSGAGSLRQAILDAEAHPRADTITFAETVRGTIPLTSGELTITSDLTIDGPGAGKLTVSGNDTSRIFNVVGGADPSTAIAVGISGLTVANGRAPQGGGVRNAGFSDLTLTRVVASGNRAVGVPNGPPGTFARGGGVLSSGSGNRLSLIDSAVTGNAADGVASVRAAEGGGIYEAGGSSVQIRNSTVSGNQALGGRSSARG